MQVLGQVADELAVGEHDALGHARGARREGQDGHVLGGVARQLHALRGDTLRGQALEAELTGGLLGGLREKGRSFDFESAKRPFGFSEPASQPFLNNSPAGPAAPCPRSSAASATRHGRGAAGSAR